MPSIEASSHAALACRGVRRRAGEQTDGMNGMAKVYDGTIDCCKQIYRKEGMGGFFRGIVVNCIRAVPGAAIQFLAYDSLKKALGA